MASSKSTQTASRNHLRPVPSPAEADGDRFVLSPDLREQLFERLDHIEAVLHMLVHVFGGEADIDTPNKTPGLMGTVQHVNNMLGELHNEISEVQGDLPDDLRWRTFEASEMVGLLDHLQFNNGYEFDRWCDGWTCSYFAAVLAAVRRAKSSLDSAEVGELEVQHG